MKRIIARFGPNGDGLEKESPNTAAYNAYIGRQLSVGSQSVFVEEIIAEGGYGVVFKVRSLSHKYFALKRLCVNSEEDLTRSKQEMALLRQFHHKNIVRLIDAGVSRNQSGVYEVYMLLQYYRGSVREFVNKTIAHRMDIPEGTIIKIFCDMCEAVGCLHDKNIIHRDLKIENILIDDSGNYVLCDFGSATTESVIPRSHGIAKTEEEITKYTSIAYRAPEMVDLYKNLEISTKADIWALGCLLYTLCFLKLPFKDSLLAIQSGEYSIPDDSIYSRNLRKLIGFLLQPNPTERPDVFQVSVLAFQLQGHCRTPVRNSNNSSVPKFEDLPLPKTESEMKAKSASAVASPPAANAAPVTTSVVPRQRPRVGAAPCPFPSNGISPPTPGSLPPPPGDNVRPRLEPSTSHTSTETSASSIQTSPLLIDVGGGEAVSSPLCGALPEKVANGLPNPLSTDSKAPDLLSFDAPASAPALPAPPFALNVGCPRTRLALPARPPGHRRLLSDTSAVAGLGGGPMRPQVSAVAPHFSHAPRLPANLKTSCSMDFIGPSAPAVALSTPSYQMPPKPRPTSGPQQNRARPVTEEPYVNPHHQWQQPLRGNRSSSSADLINLSANVYTAMGPSRAFGASPMGLQAVSMAPTMDGLRATSALELDAFGSVPFSSTPPLQSAHSANSCDAIPPRPHPIQGHTRSASHGQCFRRP